jgi:hypothetical protein
MFIGLVEIHQTWETLPTASVRNPENCVR